MKWFNNPVMEYTAKVYSKQELQVTYNGQTNMVHMDGKSPSGFTESTYDGWRVGGGNSGGEPAGPISVADFVSLMNDEF